MKKLLAIFAVSIMAFNTPAFANQSCEDIAKDYAQNAEVFKEFYPSFMDVIPEPGAEEVYSPISRFQKTIRNLSASLKSLQENNCDTMAFIKNAYSEGEAAVLVKDGHVAARYCGMINYHNKELKSYLSDLGGDAKDKAFLLSVYEKASAHLEHPTLQDIFYQDDLFTFLSFYMPRDAVSPEAIEALTEERLMNGRYKARIALRVYQAVADFQTLRKQTFCSAE